MKKFLVLSFMLLSVTGFAAENIKGLEENGYPYFLSGGVFPQDKGIWEIIVQPQYDYSKTESELFLMPQIIYGMTDSWQVYLTFIPYMIVWDDINGRSSGLSDINFGSQYSWMYINKSTFSASVLFNIHVPTGDINKNLTDGFLRYEPAVVFAKDFIHSKWHTQLFTQVGFSIVQRLKRPSLIENELPAAHYFVAEAGLSERSKKINYHLELTWFTNTWNNNGDDNEMYLTPGVYFQVRDDVALGFGVPIGLTKDSDNYIIIGNLLVDIDTNPPKTTSNNPFVKALLHNSLQHS